MASKQFVVILDFIKSTNPVQKISSNFMMVRIMYTMSMHPLLTKLLPFKFDNRPTTVGLLKLLSEWSPNKIEIPTGYIKRPQALDTSENLPRYVLEKRVFNSFIEVIVYRGGFYYDSNYIKVEKLNFNPSNTFSYKGSDYLVERI